MDQPIIVSSKVLCANLFAEFAIYTEESPPVLNCKWKQVPLNIQNQLFLNKFKPMDNDEISITYIYTNNVIFDIYSKKTNISFMYPDLDGKMGTKWFYDLKNKLTLNF
tara:strand:- start:452 stop:775 length:324 start_codon:yes stop_codon:yes gene_type:complete